MPEMGFFNLPYHIWVKDYHWTAKKVRVQSPVLNLKKTGSPPVFRPQEGNNQNEPRVASRTDDLSDGIREAEYLTEAHGIFIPNDSRHCYIPLWVTYQQTSSAIKDGETAFVDLRSNTSRSGPISRICWVPSHRSSDGKLYTIIGGTRIWQLGKKRIQNTVVSVQEEGLPGKANLVWLSSDELSRLEPMDDIEKRRLFNMHLYIILTNHRPLSEIQRIALRLASSPRSLDNGRRAFHLTLGQDPDMYLSNWLDGSDGDDPLDIQESYYDDDTELEMVSSRSRSMQPEQNNECRTCNYPGLHPTRLNPFPEHYHGKDGDCPHGSTHEKHCIKAAHSPDKCVIPLNEPHIHCDSLQPTNEPQTGFDAPLDSSEALSNPIHVEPPLLSYTSWLGPMSWPQPQPDLDIDMTDTMLGTLPEPDFELINTREYSWITYRNQSPFMSPEPQEFVF